MTLKYELSKQIVAGASTGNRVVVDDEPGAGGTNHRYVIKGFDTSNNDSKGRFEAAERELVVLFQNGPVSDNGKNGITMEDLLAICSHRLSGFTSLAFSCDESKTALSHINAAIRALNVRTIKRLHQGVEGQRVAHVDSLEEYEEQL